MSAIVAASGTSSSKPTAGDDISVAGSARCSTGSAPTLPMSKDTSQCDETHDNSATELTQAQLPLNEKNDADDTSLDGTRTGEQQIGSNGSSDQFRSEPIADGQKLIDASSAASNSAQQMGSLELPHQHPHAFSYPQDLNKVLMEVASTGACSWLPWNGSVELETGKKKRQVGNEHKASQGQRGGYKRLRKNPSVLSSSVRNMGAKHKLQNNLNNRAYYPNARTSTATATETISVESWIENLGEDASNPSSTSDQDAASMPNVRTYRNGTSHVQTVASRGNRKRPLFLVRGQAGGSNASAPLFSPGSVGSARTSGSEHEDTSQYECDSEGTSATSNSEISFEHGRGMGNARLSYHPRHGRLPQDRITGKRASKHNETSDRVLYNSLRQAFRVAINLVLDYFYAHHGGYKLSRVESKVKDELVRKHQGSVPSEHKNLYAEAVVKNEIGTKTDKATGYELRALESSDKPEVTIFYQRKNRLLDMLEDASPKRSSETRKGPVEESPPFTIQRIAEVLLSPVRCYTQTHKLCNCLEKLLLVKSSTTSFGGSTGGNMMQNLKEETELAALSQERNRLRSEFRSSQRRLRRKSGSPVSDDADLPPSSMEGNQNKREAVLDDVHAKPLAGPDGDGTLADDEEDDSNNVGSALDTDASQELLEAAARASLRTKFDHVGMDAAVINREREARSMVEKRAMTNSPPPPILGLAPNPGITIPCVHGGILRQHHHGSSLSPTSPEKELLVRTPSPIHLGISPSGSPPIAPMLASHGSIPMLQMQHATSIPGLSSFQLVGYNSSLSGAPSLTHFAAARDLDAESRSSASSDVDSESDFDDSASDRSDGSDSGQHYEPFTAARAMALNRIQQQQRIQSRMFTSLHTHGGGIGESFRPPADSEYQSGDSIDSTRAVDSGDSDSSSSDMAD